MRVLIGIALALGLAACDTPGASSEVLSATGPLAPLPTQRTGSPQTEADFRRVVSQVAPIAERECRRLRPNTDCDFKIVIDERPGQPPNAFQTLERDGRPVIGFTSALFAEMRNRDELAFALAHEAAHHIEGHIPQSQNNALAGALLGGFLGAAFGLDQTGVEIAQDIGGNVGARRYSKDFELEADSLGTRIALLAGFDPLRGVLYFQRARDPGDQFLGTHPPNADRIRVVQRTVASRT